jgi:hypothetical protein
MEFNKIVSLVLGFIVAILLLVWVTNQFKANRKTTTTSQVRVTMTPTPAQKKNDTKWNPFGFLFKKTTPTPSVQPNRQTAQNANMSPTPNQAQRAMPTTRPQPTSQTGASTTTGQNNQQPPQGQNQGSPQYNNYQNPGAIAQIPNTGAPTFLIPLALSSLAGGMFLRRKKN